MKVLNGAAHAKTGFWAIESSIFLITIKNNSNGVSCFHDNIHFEHFDWVMARRDPAFVKLRSDL
jgi:hypothetical protein